jgi:O-antigen ligase
MINTVVSERPRSRQRPLPGHSQTLMRSQGPTSLVRYAYYAFIFSIPFEEVLIDAGIGTGNFSPPKMIGYMLVLSALLQPSLFIRRLPKAVWYFFAYLLVFLFLGLLGESKFQRAVIVEFFRYIQLLILFWISYSVMQYERVVKGTFLVFTIAATLMAVLQISGVTSTILTQGRITATGAKPNTFCAVLSLGLLALIGLAYSRKVVDTKVRWLTWLGSGALVIAIINTGSRGPVVALSAALMIFLLKDRSLISKLKAGLIVLLAIGALIWASYQVESVRARWERTLTEGHLSKRDRIWPQAWAMVQEKPLLGWGPINALAELWDRVAREPGGTGRLTPVLDTHNLSLRILTETGLLGALPFFAALWLCGRAAWRARNSIQGVFPLAMLVCVLLINTAATWHNRKVFWVVLAYALASGTYVALPRVRRLVTRPYRLARH